MQILLRKIPFVSMVVDMTSQENRRITDLGTLKAIAHPLRMRLYRALFVARTATASQLAEQLDEAVSLVSYHLRKLAEHGLIEEAEAQSADGRERWWQPSSYGLSIRDEDVRGNPETAAASDAVGRTIPVEDISRAEAEQQMGRFMPPTMVASLLDLWAAASHGPATVADTTESLLGRPARTYREWARENAAAFTAQQ